MTTENKSRSYWSITWQQLKRKKLVMASLGFLIFLLFLATYAPYISSDVPFQCEINGEIKQPFFKELFNVRRYTATVDIVYNLFSFFLLPLTLLHVFLFLFKKSSLIKWSWFFGMVLFALSAIVLSIDSGREKTNFLNQTQRIEYEVCYGQPNSIFPINPISYVPNQTKDNRKEPGYKDDYNRTFIFGTDDKCRGVLAMLLYGTRISLSIGLVAVGIYIAIGTFLGALAGYYGGWVDISISRLIEIMICFPSFLLIMTLVAFVKDPSIFYIMLIIGITGWTGVARLVRAEFLKLRELDFVIAARALGGKPYRIIFKHVLPNALGPVIVTAAFGVPAAILVESGLSFLGLGDVNSPSWGQILEGGRITDGLYWLIHPPGIAIFLTVSAMNLLGDGLRDALDPKLRGR